MPSGSLRSAQTWSQGHLRGLASDAYAAALNDAAESKLDIKEGGVSPWKADKVCPRSCGSLWSMQDVFICVRLHDGADGQVLLLGSCGLRDGGSCGKSLLKQE